MISSLLPRPKHSRYLQPVLGAHGSGEESQSQDRGKNLQRAAVSSAVQRVPKTNVVDASTKVLSYADIATRGAQSTYQDAIPLKKRYPNLRHHFPRYTRETCPDESLEICISETKKAIDKILGIEGEDSKKKSAVSYVKYAAGDEERTLEIRQVQVDPMLPPKFKLRKNRHREPSPPPPILKDTSLATQKLTKEDREKWNIPAAVSNWKNNQGFALSLDDRIRAANSGDSTSDVLNVEKFSTLSSALEGADKEARVEIAMRNRIRQEQAIKDQQEKEEKLRELAVRARNEKYRRSDYGLDSKRARR